MAKQRLNTRIIIKLTEDEKQFFVNNLPENQTISDVVRKLLRENRLIPAS